MAEPDTDPNAEQEPQSPLPQPGQYVRRPSPPAKDPHPKISVPRQTPPLDFGDRPADPKAPPTTTKPATGTAETLP